MIQRSQVVTEAEFSIGCNIVLSKSKKMTPARQEALLTVETVRIVVCDAGDPDNVLVDEEVPASEFSTGSVGYKLNGKGLQFSK